MTNSISSISEADQRDDLKRHNRVSITFTQPSRTKQSFREETNINSIMARYEKSGQMPQLNQNIASYGDFSHSDSYQESVTKIRDAHELFESMPSQVRAHFENSPEIFLEYASNIDNIDTLRQMGLAEPLEEKHTPTPPEDKETLKTQTKSPPEDKKD